MVIKSKNNKKKIVYKKDLVKRVVDGMPEATGFKMTEKNAEILFDQFLGQIEKAFKKGENVMFTNSFGLQIVTRKARIGMNPTNKTKVKVPACKTVKIKVSRRLKRTLNK